MLKRRIYLWIGAVALLLVIAALVTRPWNAQAAYPTGSSANNSSLPQSQSQSQSYHPQSLADVPLREDWW